MLPSIRFPMLLLLACLLLGFSSAGRPPDPAAASFGPSDAQMVSPGYRLDWLTPLAINAGGSIVSPSFRLDYSLGQVAVDRAASNSRRVFLGYWSNYAYLYHLLLPLITH